MADLVAFLEARITEDESIARAATQGRWSVDEHSDYDDPMISTDGPRRSSYDEGYVAQTRYDNQSGSDHNSEADAVFIAHNDPARVLAECKAKRAFLSRHVWWQMADDEKDPAVMPELCDHDSENWPCSDLRAMAQVYGGHPDFDPTWTL